VLVYPDQQVPLERRVLLVALEVPDRQALPVALDRPAWPARPVLPEVLVPRALLAPPGRLERPEVLAHLDSRAVPAVQVWPGSRDLRALQDRRAPPDQPAVRGQQVLVVERVLWGPQELRAAPDLLERLDPPGCREHRVHLEVREILDQLVHPVDRVLAVCLVQSAPRAIRVDLVVVELRAR